MSDLRKAAEMALDALHNIDQSNNYDAIEALRQALAMEKFSKVNQEIEEALKQPEQEPFIYVREDNERPFGGYEHCSKADAGAFPVYTAPPKREWVGLEDEDVATVKNEFNRGALWAEQVLKEKNKREWVGLTEEEALDLLPVGEWEVEPTLVFAKAIEAKLKEKNT